MSKHPLYNTTGLQKNNKSHVLYALADKQLELQQLKEEYNKKLAKLQNDLTAIEATICLFDENCSETIEKIKQKATSSKKKVRLFKNGELASLVLKFLKESGGVSLSIRELANKISDHKQFENKDIRSNVKDTIKALSKRNLLENEYDYDKGVLCYRVKALDRD